MYNFMGCSTMMYGPRSFYCITYKSNQIGFNIYRRMYHHNFLVNLRDESYEDCQGITVNSNNTYIIAIKNEIRVYSQATFQIIDTIQVPFKENVHVKREGEQSQEALI